MLDNTWQSPGFRRRTRGTTKMQVLLLTLVLGLVCADQETKSEDGHPPITGDWYTLLIASTNSTMIDEDGPFRGYIRQISCEDDCDTVSLHFYSKMNGECQKQAVLGIRTENEFYNMDYEGENRFQFKFTQSDFLVIYAENTEADGKKTLFTELLGKTRETNENAYKEFKQVTKEKGIPTENTQNVIKTDTCPLTID